MAVSGQRETTRDRVALEADPVATPAARTRSSCFRICLLAHGVFAIASRGAGERGTEGGTNASNSAACALRVDLPDLGVVCGRSLGASHVFLGIPFAEPPTGLRRWTQPEPKAAWRPQLLPATVYGPNCMQNKPNPGGDAQVSEDCLTLNIYAPVKPIKASLDLKSVPATEPACTIHTSQNGATSGFEMCCAIGSQHSAPSVLGVATKTRLESSIKKFKPHFIYDGFFAGRAARAGAAMAVWRRSENHTCTRTPLCQNGTTSGFQMCFCYRIPAPWVLECSQPKHVSNPEQRSSLTPISFP